MQTNKTVLDDALRSLRRRLIQSVAGSAAVMAAAGGILVVPEILSEKNVTAALATLSEPKDQIQSVITVAASYSQRAKEQLAQMDPAAGAPAQPRIMVANAEIEQQRPLAMLTSPSATIQDLITPDEPVARAAPPVAAMPSPAPAASAPRVLPEARQTRFRMFDPMPDLSAAPVEAPREPEAPAVAEAPKPAVPVAQAPTPVASVTPVASAVTPAERPSANRGERKRPEPIRFGAPAVPVAVPEEKASPTPVAAAEPAAPAFRMPAVEAPKPRVAETKPQEPIASLEPTAQPRREPLVVASADPSDLGIASTAAPVAPGLPDSTLALISAEAFGNAPIPPQSPEEMAPLPGAKPPAVEEEIPTEIYKGPDALKPTLVAPPPQAEKLEEKPKWKTPAETLGLTGKQRARAERCLASAVYFESRNEPVRGQIAVAQVVMNRVFSPFYPGDVCSVVYQNAHRHLSCQFTFACDGIPDRVTERGPWARAQRIAKQALDGKVWRPEVAKATHYHADYVKPKWIRDMRTLAKHGRHIFYRPHNWGDGRQELGWVREHEMPMPKARPVMLASVTGADAFASAAPIAAATAVAAPAPAAATKPVAAAKPAPPAKMAAKPKAAKPAAAVKPTKATKAAKPAKPVRTAMARRR